MDGLAGRHPLNPSEEFDNPEKDSIMVAMNSTSSLVALTLVDSHGNHEDTSTSYKIHSP
jgi:hypothetical protein